MNSKWQQKKGICQDDRREESEKVTCSQNREIRHNTFIKNKKKIEKATMNEQLKNRLVKAKDVAQHVAGNYKKCKI